MIDRSNLIQLCGGGRCPRVFLTDKGDFIVQGLLVDTELRDQLDPLESEEIVRLPREVVDELLRHYQTG